MAISLNQIVIDFHTRLLELKEINLKTDGQFIKASAGMRQFVLS